MARTTSHHKGHVQHDRPAAPPPPEGATGPGGSPQPAPAGELSRQWQTVAFLWITSFVFLWAFELLAALFKAL